MTTIKKHYDGHLAEHYSWIYGGAEAKIAENEAFFNDHNIAPFQTNLAIDLGAGSGFQSIPLAKSGFRVTAVDISKKLLRELQENKGALDISIVEDDFISWLEGFNGHTDVIVCMGDTLTHLDSLARVEQLMELCAKKIVNLGKLILTFRDYTFRLQGTDRIIPVTSEKDRIFTCFLDYEEEYVNVYDIVHTRSGGKWEMKKSGYRKVIIPQGWLIKKLEEAGFSIMKNEVARGMITIIAEKP